MPATVIISITRLPSGGYSICDAVGGVHDVAPNGDIRTVLDALIDNGDVPPVEQVRTERFQFEEAIQKVAENIAPVSLRPFAGPVARMALDRLVNLSDKRHSRRRAR
jgi:hypothetical protein